MSKAILLTFLTVTAIDLKAADDTENLSPNYSELFYKLETGLLREPYSLAPFDLFTKQENVIRQNSTWCFVGDNGVDDGAQGQVVARQLKHPPGCNRIYFLGDLIYPAGIKSPIDPDLDKKFFNFQKPFINPTFLVLGDHDYYSLKVDPWLDVAKATPGLEFPYYYYGHNTDGICVIAADTTPLYRGQLDDPRPKQMISWIKDLKDTRLQSCRFKIFIGHHSYATLNKWRKPPETPYKSSLRDFFEKNILGDFDIVFSGHDHALAYIGSFEGTDQYISGAGGNYTKPGDDRMQFADFPSHPGPGIIQIKFLNRNATRMELQIKALEGPNLDQETIVYRKCYEVGDR